MRPSLIAAIIVIIDQIAKRAVTVWLNEGESFAVINKILSLTLVKNTGAAFGLFKDQTVFFILVSIFAIVFIGFYFAAKRAVYYLPLAFILGGAAGNLIDRIRFGYVIDFIDFHFWPVFNFADSSITAGAGIIFFMAIRRKNASDTL